MENNPVTIAEFEYEYEAQIAQTRLTDGGIKSVIVGQDLVANMVPMPEVTIELQVSADNAKEARAILESDEQSDKPAGDEPAEEQQP